MASRLCEFLVREGIPFAAGYSLLLLGALLAVPALMAMNVRKTSFTPPPEVDEGSWKQATEIDERGRLSMMRIYGWMEATYFYLSLWIGAPLLVGGWLVFKLGSKWEVWQTIIKVPGGEEKLDTVGVARFGARNRWGSKVLLAHLMGTLANILIAVVAVGVGRLLTHVLFGEPLVWIPVTSD